MPLLLLKLVRIGSESVGLVLPEEVFELPETGGVAVVAVDIPLPLGAGL